MQPARVLLTEALSAFVSVGVTRLAMMRDLSRGKRSWEVRQVARAKEARTALVANRGCGPPQAVASRGTL